MKKVAVNSAQSAVSAALAELARARSEEASYRDLLERGLTTRTAYIEQQTADQDRAIHAAASHGRP